MASCTLSIWFSHNADKALLPLKEIRVFLQTHAIARQRTTAVAKVLYFLTDEARQHSDAKHVQNYCRN